MAAYKPGQIVEYDRQTNAPPVIAEFISDHGDGTATVESRHILDEHDRIIPDGRHGWRYRLTVAELRPARKFYDPETIR